MNEKINIIKELWRKYGIPKANKASEDDFVLFHKKTGLIIPEDLRNYFMTLNGMSGEYDQDLFCFYSFKEFKSIDNGLKNWNGTPDYSNIVSTLRDYKQCFVFADYMFHMYAYCIRLSNSETSESEVCVLCGDKFNVIANSFSEFIELYLSKSEKLNL